METEPRVEWESRIREVDRITDGLMRPVDPRIKPIVIALRANGFETSGSCEGHPDAKHGSSLPRVSFNAPLVQGGNWQAPLREFYTERSPPRDARLVVISGSKRELTLSCAAAMRMGRASEEARSVLEAAQKQMDRFAHFLREWFFEKGLFMARWSP